MNMRTLATLSAICALGMPASSAAQGQDNVHGLSVIERMVHRRAVEAAVWSLPLINFKAMRDAQASLGAGYNDVAYYSKIQTWQFQIATPNNTTPYIISFWNLADGPIVVELPPSTPDVGIFGTLMDSWQRPLEDVGAKGYDKGRGGKYLLLPPDYRGGFPPGYIPLQQATYQGFTLLRPIIADASEENLAKAAAFAKSIKVYPFAKAGGEAQTRYVDLAGKLFDGIVDFDAGFYEHLSAIVQEEIVPKDELAMMGLLKSIGIQNGVDFAPDERTKEILGAAASEAHEYLVQRYHEGILPVWYDGKHWMSIVPPGTVETGFSFRFPGYVDYDFRGALYYAVCTSAKHLGGATFYLTAAQDADGMWLDGGSTYKFTVAADVPVEDFWSVVAYDVKSAAWILEQPKVGLDSIDKAVQASPDGSVDIYFGPEAPAGKEGNWVPTVAGRRFFLLFRFYGPKPAVFTKTWVLNDLVKIK